MKTYLSPMRLFLLMIIVIVTACNEDEVVPVKTNQLVAVAGTDLTVELGEEILFDGSASHDKLGKSISYLWLVKSRPVGSTSVLVDPTSAKPKLTADKAGQFVILLRIAQDSWSASDEITVTVKPEVVEEPSTIVINEAIVANVTLSDIFDDPSQPDYLVTDDIQIRADIAIDPGVTIMFQENTSFQIIEGSIKAVGTLDQPIALKGSEESSGYWKGLWIYSNSEINQLDNVIIQHGGSNSVGDVNVKANLVLVGSSISGAAVKINNSTFSQSGGYGLYLQGMSSLNAFSNNLFNDNQLAAAYIPAQQLNMVDGQTSISNNGNTSIETGGAITQLSAVTWKKFVNGSYRVTSDLEIGSGVIVEPGVLFEIEQAKTIKITGFGYLNASGTSSSKIGFTAADNSQYWNGIFFNTNDQNNKLIHCEISRAGKTRITGVEHPGNVVVGESGMLTVEASVIRDGLGYGVVAKSRTQLNGDVSTANQFLNVASGNVFPAEVTQPELPALEGVWLDRWSFLRGEVDIAPNVYDQESGIWFEGASTPWEMESAAFGIRFDQDGSFTWTIAEHSPMTGCVSYSAEYITGSISVTSNIISFEQDYWRSKFYNGCDESQNVDIGVETSTIPIQYQINQIHHPQTGEPYWELKFINPDNSTFSLYRK